MDDGRVVFIGGALPGDTVLARVKIEKKRHTLADLVEIIEPSGDRRPSPCPQSGHCGGCPWISLDYDVGLWWKRNITQELLSRIGNMSISVTPCERSPVQLYYRSRVRLLVTVSGESVALGFRRPKSHGLAPVNQCPVANDSVNTIMSQLSRYLNHDTGLARRIREVRVEAIKGNGRIAFHFKDKPLKAEMDRIASAITSVNGVVGLWKNRSVESGDLTLSTPTAGGGSLLFGHASFSQVNPSVNLLLTDEVRRMAQLSEGKTGLDLFCGMGNFTLALGVNGSAMTGIDSSPEAIEYAMTNRARLGISATGFTCQDALEGARELARHGLEFDTVVIDPPRGGAQEFAPTIATLAKSGIIYISCDPPSLARDAAKLHEHGFDLYQARPFDMFPQTAHVEVAALFKRR